MKRLIALLIIVSSFAFATDTYRVIRSGDLIKTTTPYASVTRFSRMPTARTAGGAITSPNAIIGAGTTMVQITSTGANDLIVLPTPVVGQKIDIIADASTACELRPVLQTQYINGTECTPNKELVITAGSIFHATAVVAGSAGKWVITQSDGDGTTDAGGTPD